MSLESTNTVDAVGIETSSDSAVLTIADSWGWRDEHAHLLALQAKINAYFEFIESGQIWEDYPGAKGKKLRIDVITKFPLTKAAKQFLERASDAASELDVVVRHRHFEE